MLTNETAKWRRRGAYSCLLRCSTGDASDASGGVDDETWSARKEMRYAYTGKTRKKSDWTGVQHFWVRVVLQPFSPPPRHDVAVTFFVYTKEERRHRKNVWFEKRVQYYSEEMMTTNFFFLHVPVNNDECRCRLRTWNFAHLVNPI